MHMSRFAKILAVVILALAIGIPAVSAGNTSHDEYQLAGLDVGNAYCEGSTLKVDLEVTINTNLYRVNGTGPNLPSAYIAYPGSFTFTIAGPGNWSSLILEYSSDGGSSWSTSYRPVTPDSIICEAAVVIPGPGPDMVTLPAQAVVGAFNQTTELLFAPDTNAGTGIVMTAGKTLWVLGVDSSGMYYKVLVSGKSAWVPVGSMGPNFDDVWNGAPLPTTVVE